MQFEKFFLWQHVDSDGIHNLSILESDRDSKQRETQCASSKSSFLY